MKVIKFIKFVKSGTYFITLKTLKLYKLYSMQDCVFCNIINHTIESEFLLETEDLIVIKDVLPKAPVHLLVIPKKHIVSIYHLTAEDEPIVGKMIFAAKQMTEKLGVGESGYKLVFNVGRDGGMVVPHLHLHVMGGKKLAE